MTPTAHAKGRDEILVRCGCGIQHTRGAWQRLPLCGYQRSAEDGALESRHCPCGSTRSIDLGLGFFAIGGYLLLRSSENRWERSVNHPRWHGRIGLVRLADRWVVTVVLIDKVHGEPDDGGELNSRWSHREDPEVALANALERLELPTEFLAAFTRPL